MLMRSITRVFAFAFAATLVLTGCERATEPSEPAPAPLPENVRRWVLIEGEQGAALTLLGEGDRQVFHLACLAEPARLQVIAAEATVIGSEERLTLGAADEAFGLVADVERGGPGVHAEAAIDPSFLDHLARTDDISAMYGAQQLGPYPAPTADDRARFIAGCRALVRAAAEPAGELPETEAAT